MKQTILLFLTLLMSNFIYSQTSYRPPAIIEREYDSIYNSLLINPGDVGDTLAKPLMRKLIEMEAPHLYEEELSNASRQLFKNTDSLVIMINLERAIKEDSLLNLFVKEKLLKALSLHINLLCIERYSEYTYDTKYKRLIKFVSLRTGNDLFTLAGLFGNFFLPNDMYIGDNNSLFQRNDDRDYTGSLLIEIGTDFLSAAKRKPLMSYQTLLYGFDVYTPYFKDTTIFKYDTSYNHLDRPHASFQYFGWSKKVIAKDEKARTTLTIKTGLIGGRNGEKFQNTLHQDVSYSPRPKGWGAQIAKNGRLGLSVEFKHEFLGFSLTNKHENSFRNLYLMPFYEAKIGTYMTTSGCGLQISNKNFKQNNSNFINHRTKQAVYNKWHHLMYSVSFIAVYVQHNTMLEGYGIFKTKETNDDPLTPKSIYYLKYEQVKRINCTLNYTISYTTRSTTFFYNWKMISPETNLAGIGVLSPSGNEMDISKRWQHFAEIGVTFNIHH